MIILTYKLFFHFKNCTSRSKHLVVDDLIILFTKYVCQLLLHESTPMQTLNVSWLCVEYFYMKIHQHKS